MSQFRLICLYIFNKVDFDKFCDIFAELFNIYKKDNYDYLLGKWDDFNRNQMSFIINHKGFDEVVLKMIKKENYQG